jgi:serine/threonine protein kinase
MLLKAKPEEPTQAGDYDLLEKRGEGSMGVVYRARHRVSGDIVAVKVVHEDVASNDVLLRRLEREFEVARRLDHPHMVRSLDVSVTTTPPYLVMEYVDGLSLGDIIDSRGALPEREAVSLITQVAEALHEAHQNGIYHRDIKPDNILLTSDGQAKLTDLGLAKDLSSGSDLTNIGRALGTPNFMAPEQMLNAKNVDARCDVYGLGATLYMMTTGAIPFGANEPLVTLLKKKARNEYTPPRKLQRKLSGRVEEVIKRAMDANIDHRYQTCRDFIAALGGKSSVKTQPPSSQPLSKEKQPSEISADKNHSEPVSERQLDESVTFEDSRVLVTTTRVVIDGTTYATANLGSVAVDRVPPDLSTARVIISVGIVSGVCAFFLGRFAIPVGLFSLVPIIFGLWAHDAAKAKSKYAVQASRGSREFHLLVSPDGEYVTKIVNAINQAISERASAVAARAAESECVAGDQTGFHGKNA